MLVGRDRQVRQLRADLDSLSRGRGGLVLVVGDAGIGKTRLAEEAIALACDDGIDARRTTCWAEAGAPPFWPWIQLLRELGAGPVEVADEPADRELARFQLFTTVSDALRAAARERPRLLVLDDLHWADAPSVRLLSFLAPTLRDQAALVVATYRGSEVDGPSQLGATLPDLVRHGRQLAVPPLERGEFAEFVADLGDCGIPPRLVDRLYALTAGNPFFAREVVSLLDANGTLATPDVDELPVPDSVLTTLTGRLATVSYATREALSVASVVGVEFRADLVAAVANLDPDALVNMLDEAERAGLARSTAPGRAAFAHPLIREAAYRELGLARRVRLHTDVAETLERMQAEGRDVDPAELAYHFGQASPGGVGGKAVDYAQLAGDRALSLLAYEAAVAHFEDALETLLLCPPNPERRADLLLRLGDARLAAGDLPGARVAFEDAAALARDHHWPHRLAHAALGRGSGTGGFEVAAFDTEQVALLREALALSDTADDRSTEATRAWLLARLSVALWGQDTHDERLRLSDEAIRCARDAGDERALGYALAAHCDIVPGPDHCEERLAEASEILTLARAARDAPGELLARRLRAVALAELGRFGEFDGEVEAYTRVADALRQPLYAWYPPLWRECAR